MRILLKIIIVFALATVAVGSAAQDKVVYHFDSGIAQATKGLRTGGNRTPIA